MLAFFWKVHPILWWNNAKTRREKAKEFWIKTNWNLNKIHDKTKKTLLFLIKYWFYFFFVNLKKTHWVTDPFLLVSFSWYRVLNPQMITPRYANVRWIKNCKYCFLKKSRRFYFLIFYHRRFYKIFLKPACSKNGIKYPRKIIPDGFFSLSLIIGFLNQ